MFKKGLAVILGGGGAAVFNFLSQSIMAKNLSAEDFGIISAAISLSIVLSSFCLFGSNTRIIIEGVINSSIREKLFAIALNTGFFNLLFIVFISAGVCSLIGDEKFDVYFITLLLMLTLSLFLYELGIVLFQLNKKFYYLSLWQAHIGFMRLIVILMLIGLSIDKLYLHIVMLSVVALITIIYFICNMNKVVRLSFISFSKYMINLRCNFKLFFANISFVIFFQLPISLLAMFSSPENAAKYSLCITVLSSLYLLPGLILQKFLFPFMVAWSQENRVLMKKVTLYTIILSMIIGIILALITSNVFDNLITYIYGDKYNELSELLNIMLLGVPLRYLSSAISNEFISVRKFQQKSYAFISAALIMIAVIVFMPAESLIDTIAYSYVFGELLIALWFTFILKFSEQEY